MLSIETHNASIIEFSRNSLALQNLVQEHSKELFKNSKLGVRQTSNDSSITLPYSDMAMSTHEVRFFILMLIISSCTIIPSMLLWIDIWYKYISIVWSTIQKQPFLSFVDKNANKYKSQYLLDKGKYMLISIKMFKSNYLYDAKSIKSN